MNCWKREEWKSSKKYEKNLGKLPKHIISTKILSAVSIEKFEKAGIKIYSYEAVPTEFIGTSEIKNKILDLGTPLIFTSKNGVSAALKLGISDTDCYAISPVTVAFAKEAGFRPKGSANNSKELAELIVTNLEQEICHITTGDRRMELAEHLNENGVKLHEFECYKKRIHAESFTDYDGVLFFAPSQIDAFVKTNEINNRLVFCIGKTTATYAETLGVSPVKHCKISSEKNLVDLAIQYMTNE